MRIINKAIAKNITLALLTLVSMTLLSGCVTQSFENDEPIVQTQANRNEMAATRVSLGLGYLKMGDMPQAKLNLEKAKAFSPKLVQVHTAFAHYYETVGEEALAKESFEQALVIKADSADTLNNYGVFLCRQGHVAEAETQFLKAIAVPSYLLVSQSYENLSSCYLQNDNFDKAEMYLNKAIFHNPARTATLLQMVRLKYAMGNYKEAKRYLQKFERNTQRFSADSLSLAYKVYWKLGQRRTASNYANMLVKMYPQSWEGKQYLLNGLDTIAADELAKRYQLSDKYKNRTLASSSNKRVVRLSPKKSNNTSYTESVKSGDSSQKVNSQLSTSKAFTSATSATNSATNSAAIVVASTTVPNTASTVAVVKGATTTSEITPEATASETATANPESNTPTPAMSTPEVATNTTTNSVVTESSTASLTPVATVSGAAVSGAATATTSTLNAGAVALTATAAGVLATTSSADEDVIVEDEAKETAVEEVAVATAVVTETTVPPQEPVIEQTIASEIEPTSTQPIAAQRDVPLPEPIEPEPELIVEPVLEPVAEVQSEITPEIAIEKQADVEAPAETVAEQQVAALETVTEEKVIKDADTVDAKDVMHTVSPGQNLYNISVKYNVKLSALRKWNNISENNKIRIGDKLYVVDPQTVNIINE